MAKWKRSCLSQLRGIRAHMVFFGGCFPLVPVSLHWWKTSRNCAKGRFLNSKFSLSPSLSLTHTHSPFLCLSPSLCHHASLCVCTLLKTELGKCAYGNGRWTLGDFGQSSGIIHLSDRTDIIALNPLVTLAWLPDLLVLSYSFVDFNDTLNDKGVCSFMKNIWQHDQVRLDAACREYTVHSQSIQTPWLFPHFATLQPYSKKY